MVLLARQAQRRLPLAPRVPAAEDRAHQRRPHVRAVPALVPRRVGHQPAPRPHAAVVVEVGPTCR
jgi:hypothetical protein